MKVVNPMEDHGRPMDRNCRFKEKNEREKKRTCWRCGSEGYISRDCPDKAAGVKPDKRGNKQESHSNYLRAKDCKWCGKEYRNDFTCWGCFQPSQLLGIA